MKKTAFDIFHPSIPASYFVAVLGFAMAALQPVYIVLSLTGALAYSTYLQGWRSAAKNLIWQIPMIVLITLINPLFSSKGSTELFSLGPWVFYLESLVYGACFGALLVAVLIWFSNAAQVLTSDKVSSLLGNRLPTLALMISMMLRLVPRFLTQGKEIQVVQQVNCPRSERTKKQRLEARVREVSVLMGWSMENSLETADSMRARGWGSAPKRTTYQRYHIKLRDILALAVLTVLVLSNVVLAVIVLDQSHFYPSVVLPSVFWGYLPYTLLVFLPLIVQRWEDKKWK